MKFVTKDGVRVDLPVDEMRTRAKERGNESVPAMLIELEEDDETEVPLACTSAVLAVVMEYYHRYDSDVAPKFKHRNEFDTHDQEREFFEKALDGGTFYEVWMAASYLSFDVMVNNCAAFVAYRTRQTVEETQVSLKLTGTTPMTDEEYLQFMKKSVNWLHVYD